MLDARLRPIAAPTLERMAAVLDRAWMTPDRLTVLGLVTGLASAASSALQWWPTALVLWLLSRVADGLDGPLARRRADRLGVRDAGAGGFLDITCDFVVYGATVVGVAVGATAGGGAPWWPFLLVLLAYYVNGTALLAFSSIAERAERTRDDGRSLVLPRGTRRGHRDDHRAHPVAGGARGEPGPHVGDGGVPHPVVVGRVGVRGGGQVPGPQTLTDHHGQLAQGFARPRSDDRRTDHPPPAVQGEAAEPRGVGLGDRPVEVGMCHRGPVGGGDAHRRHLGLGERHPWHHKVDAAAQPQDRVCGHETAVHSGDVGELRVPGDVPGRPNPWVRGAEVVVDPDVPAVVELHPGGGQAQARGAGGTADRDEHSVGLEPLSGLKDERAPFRSPGPDPGAHGDRVGLQGLGDSGGRGGVLPGQQPPSGLHDRDGGPEPGEGLGELAADGPAAQHHETGGAVR